MAQITNSIGVSAPIAPFDTTDTYPTHFAKYGKGGYFTVQSFSELSNTPPARLEPGSLAYVREEELFYLYKNNEWISIDLLDGSIGISDNVEPVKPEELPQYLQSIDRGSKYIIYVDPNHSNATDAKTNKGNSPLRPFKTIERACLEATRKSFKEDGTINTPNDFSERVTIYLAPATYIVNNGKGGVAYDLEFNKRRDASQLILANKDWLIDRAYTHAGLSAYIDTVTIDANERNRLKTACKRDLNIYISGIASDIATAGNYNVLLSANRIKPDGTFIAAYNETAERENTETALNKIRDDIQAYVIKNTADTQGGVKLAGIVPDTDVNNPCSSISSEVAVLVEILTSTLNTTWPAPSIETAREGLYSMAFPEKGEPTPNNLQSFNNPYIGGIILPRGVSIIGADLRKVVIRPKYVPKKDGSEGQAAIFRMTGGNYFSGFTVKDHIDALDIGSHHNLSCFEFCSLQDLQLYYNNVATVFRDNKDFNLLFDASNLLFFNTNWLYTKVKDIPASTVEELDYKTDFEKYTRLFISSLSTDLKDQTSTNFKYIVSKFKVSYVDTIVDANKKTAALAAYKEHFRVLYDYMVDVISNRANTSEGGYIDPNVPEDKTNPTNPCQDVQAIIYNFYQLFGAIIDGSIEANPYPVDKRFTEEDVEAVLSENQIVGVLGNNTVVGSSPYIFSASLRSEWGMSGINGNGGVVAGFRSYLAAQFTVISLQRDSEAFIYTGGAAEKEVNNQRYRGSNVEDLEDWRHYGYRVANGAYAQLVSCFCIGPALHYKAESGGEFSITNSTSNFGDVSLYSEGFNDYIDDKPQLGNGAFTQDSDHQLVGMIRPVNLDFTKSSLHQSFNIGSVVEYHYSTDSSLGDPSTYNGWQTPKEEWLNWVDSYFDTLSTYTGTTTNTITIPGVNGEPNTSVTRTDTVTLQGIDSTGTVLNRKVDYPLYTEFSSIKYIKVRITGGLEDLPPSIRMKDGKPDLRYIYAPKVSENSGIRRSAPLDLSAFGENGTLYAANVVDNYDEDLFVRDKTTITKWIETYGNFNSIPTAKSTLGVVIDYDGDGNQETVDLPYNYNIYQQRKAPVVDTLVVNVGGVIYTDIIIDVSAGPNIVGEWFERSSVYGLRLSGSISTIRTSLIGNTISVKRFVDRRTSAQKSYRLLFKKHDSEKRIPPSNYILRKSGETKATQPFKLIDTNNLNSLYYVVNPQPVTEDLLNQIGDSNYTTLYSLGAQGVEDLNYFFVAELYSANSDINYRALTELDVTETDKFYFYADAEELSSATTPALVKQYSANLPGYYPELADVSNLVYQSAIQLYGRADGNCVLDLLGVPDNRTNFYVATNGVDSRVILFGTKPTVDFCKPSTIRASGHTWEYCGYYNYSTGIPELQKENIGDKVPAGQRRQHVFEKIQKSIGGGRIYSTGMDELGNVIQGNTISNLKTGEVETLVLGTSTEVISLNTTSESNPEVRVPQRFNTINVGDIKVENTFTAEQSAIIDYRNVDPRNILMPGSGSAAGSEIIYGSDTQAAIKLAAKTLNIQDPNTIQAKTFIQQPVVPLREEEILGSPVQHTLELPAPGTTLWINPELVRVTNRPNAEVLSANYTLSKMATDSEVEFENSNTTYVTPAQLKLWRRKKQLLQASTQSETFNVYITHLERHTLGLINSQASSYESHNNTHPSLAMYHGQAITPDEIAIHNAILENTDYFEESTDGTPRQVQFSDPTKPDFRAYKAVDGSLYGILYTHSGLGLNNIQSQNDTITLYLDGGKYRLDSCTFNFNVIINGVNNKGKNGVGRFDGTDTQVDGTIKSVIFYVTARFYTDGNNRANNWVYFRNSAWGLAGDGDSILQNIHIWGPLQAIQDPTLSFQHKPLGSDLNTEGFYYNNTFDSFALKYLNSSASPIDHSPDKNYSEIKEGQTMYFPSISSDTFTAPIIYISNSGSRPSKVTFTDVIFGPLGFNNNTQIRPGGSFNGSYIKISSDVTLHLYGLSLRGNLLERVDRRWGLGVGSIPGTTPGGGATIGNCHAISAPDHTPESLYPYGTNVSIGFAIAFITISSNITCEFHWGNTYIGHKETSWFPSLGSETIYPLHGSGGDGRTLNHDVYNIRLEKYTGALYGQTDSRLTSPSAIATDSATAYYYRGTDILGTANITGTTDSSGNAVGGLFTEADGLLQSITTPTPGQSSAVFEEFFKKLVNQGPMLTYFFECQDSSATLMTAPQHSIFNIWATVGDKTAGILGSFGIRFSSYWNGNHVIAPLNRYSLTYGINAPNLTLLSRSPQYYGHSTFWIKAGFGGTIPNLETEATSSWYELGVLSTHFKAGIFSNNYDLALDYGIGYVETGIDVTTGYHLIDGNDSSRLMTLTWPRGGNTSWLKPGTRIGVKTSISIVGSAVTKYNFYNIEYVTPQDEWYSFRLFGSISPHPTDPYKIVGTGLSDLMPGDRIIDYGPWIKIASVESDTEATLVSAANSPQKFNPRVQRIEDSRGTYSRDFYVNTPSIIGEVYTNLTEYVVIRDDNTSRKSFQTSGIFGHTPLTRTSVLNDFYL